MADQTELSKKRTKVFRELMVKAGLFTMKGVALCFGMNIMEALIETDFSALLDDLCPNDSDADHPSVAQGVNQFVHFSGVASLENIESDEVFAHSVPDVPDYAKLLRI